MRRFDNCRLASIAGAFGLGLMLALTCYFKLALFLAAALLILLCLRISR